MLFQLPNDTFASLGSCGERYQDLFRLRGIVRCRGAVRRTFEKARSPHNYGPRPPTGAAGPLTRIGCHNGGMILK